MAEEYPNQLRNLKLQNATDKNFNSILRRSKKNILVLFTAAWSGPDRMIWPIVEELAIEYGDKILFMKCDVDSNPKIPTNYSIMSIPTILFFSKGEVVDQVVGAVPKRQLADRIEKYLMAATVDETNEIEVSDDYIAMAVINERIRLVALSPDGHFRFIDGTKKLHNILYVYSQETEELKTQIEEFEYLINDPASSEAIIHRFFEKNPHFILNEQYKQAHSKIVLQRDEEGDLIPDFILEPLDRDALCDILEIKNPGAKVFVLKKNRPRFSAAVFEAAAQLRKYTRYFEESYHRERIKELYGLKAFRPRMFLILGRTADVDPIVRREIEEDIPGITLQTYDDVLKRMKRKIRRIK